MTIDKLINLVNFCRKKVKQCQNKIEQYQDETGQWIGNMKIEWRC